MTDFVSKAEPTLVSHMAKLDLKDQAVVIGVVKLAFPEYSHLHHGTLPFLPLLVACEALLKATPSRMCRRIQSMLTGKWAPSTYGGDFVAWQDPISTQLHLNDAKVMKRFGVAPERGVVIPNAPKINRENVIQSPMMTLRHLKKGYWQVTVLRWYKNHALTWLVDNCR